MKIGYFVANRRVLAAALLLYLPLTFFGYGSDVDSYRVLDAGRNFIATADYVPSRRPGYLIFEMSVFGLNQVGGSLLVNLATVFWALVAIDHFQRICRRHDIANASLLALILAVHPLFWYNATVTSDYIWAIGLLLLGFDWLEQERFSWAGLALGMAVGCRISSVIVAVALIFYACLRFPNQRRKVAVTAFLLALVSGLAYILPWDFSEWRASFWSVSAGEEILWSPLMQVGRFFYKNLYFWGVPAALFLGYLLFCVIRTRKKWANPNTALLVGLCCAIVFGLQVLFFRFPIEIEYLLPTLPFILLMIGVGVQSMNLLRIFLGLVFLFGFINLNIARPDQPGQASRAVFGLWIEPGYLVQEMSTRFSLLGCDTHACYDERIEQRPELSLPDD